MTKSSPDLATRVSKLEAINEIRHLKMSYAAACDDRYSPEKLAPMFTPA